MKQEASALIISMAREFISAMKRLDPNWTRAFFRFESDESHYGSNASYVTGADVLLVDPFSEKAFFDHMNNVGRELWEVMSKGGNPFCLCLLTVSSDLNYDVKFEQRDLTKWKINKANGNTGIPVGIE
jgi:hypothetical protein